MRIQMRNFDLVVHERRVKEKGTTVLSVSAETFDGVRLGGMMFESAVLSEPVAPVTAAPTGGLLPYDAPKKTKAKKAKAKKHKTVH